MRPTARTASRFGLIGGVAVLGAALAITSAQAASADLEYTCDYGFDVNEGTASARASFDSAIGDDVVVEVGEPVTLNPFTGSVTLPDEITELLRENSITSIQGNSEVTSVLILVEPDGEGSTAVPLDIGPTTVPLEGPLTLTFTGDAPEVTPLTPGTHTLLAGDLTLLLTTSAQGPIVGLGCFLADNNPDISIDAFEATTGTPTTTPTPTVTATPTASVTAAPTTGPVRPVVVQTDFAGDDRSSALPLVLGGGLLVGAGAAAVGRTRVRAGSRRH